MLEPQELSDGLYLISMFSIIGGTVFAIWATLMLAHSISIMPEVRGLVVSGPYAFVRHPLYEVLARETGQGIAEPTKLIAPMLARFMATDRVFAKLRRATQARSTGSG
jgi:hypothetical protein